MKLLLSLVFTWTFLLEVRAAERWTDPRLPQTEGLELWFDCSRQAAARKELGWPSIMPGMLASYLVDGSGHTRNLAQLQGGARPVFREEAGGQFLRFDGTNDVLIGTGLSARFKELSVFVVAAPHANRARPSSPCKTMALGWRPRCNHGFSTCSRRRRRGSTARRAGWGLG